MVEVFIRKDGNMVKYISEIRRYDPSLAIGDIRSSIQNGTAVISKELITADDIYYEEVYGTDAHTRNLQFLSLIEKLINMGAEIEIRYDGELIDTDRLRTHIRQVKEISDQVEMYPD